MTEPEDWRAVAESDGRYEVSSLGRVRRAERWTQNGTGWYLRSGRMMTLSRTSAGYLKVDMRLRGSDGSRHGGGGRNRSVHTLVMEAFFGPCPDGQEVLHGNGDKADNRLSNLRYGTRSENNLDAVKHGANVWANRTHCPAGHAYSQENTLIAKRGDGTTFRACRDCTNRRNREHRARKRIGREARGETTTLTTGRLGGVLR